MCQLSSPKISINSSSAQHSLSRSSIWFSISGPFQQEKHITSWVNYSVMVTGIGSYVFHPIAFNQPPIEVFQTPIAKFNFVFVRGFDHLVKRTVVIKYQIKIIRIHSVSLSAWPRTHFFPNLAGILDKRYSGRWSSPAYSP